MANEAIPALAALLVPGFVAWVSWWGKIPRRTRRLQGKLEILERLPRQSSQHKALRAHIDELVEEEIAADRSDRQSAALAVVLSTFVVSWVALELAQERGGLWWVLFYELAAGSLLLVGLGVWAWIRKRKRQKESPDPSTQ